MPTIIKNLGRTDYSNTWQDMKFFIDQSPTQDELWITEHKPIFTTGVNKKIALFLILIFLTYLLIEEEKLLTTDRDN